MEDTDMNKTQKIVFTIVCLLITMGGYADGYKIVGYRSLGTGTGTITATYNSISVITVEQEGEITIIPSSSSNNVTLTITPTSDSYLEKLEYEHVINLGVGQARRRATELGIGKREEININPNYANAHYGGEYSFAMPASDIVIYATFQPCTSITGANVYWDAWNGSDPLPQSKVYDGYQHTLVVNVVGNNILTYGRDYSSTHLSEASVCSITPTITGWGRYSGTISSTTLSITQKTLNIAANAGQSKVFGDSDPTFTYTQTGLCSGDQITGALSRAAGEAVGTYAINQGTLTAGGNYNIAFTSQDFAITAKDLSTVALSDEVLKVTLDHEFFNYIENTPQQAQVTEIKYNGTELSSGTSYTCAYKQIGVYTGSVGSGTIDSPQTPVDYITPDIYSIIITFTGNYQGTKEVKYQIKKPVTLNNSSYRWRTFYDPIYNMKVPEGFSAYTVRDVNTNAVEVDPRPYIKAGVPMLLHKPGDTYQFSLELVEPANEGLSGWTASGYFKRNSSDMNLGEISEIQDDTRKIWILVNDKFVRSKSGTLAADKCYLELTGSNTVSFSRQLSLEPNATGIGQSVSDFIDFEDAIWYSLDGRRLQGKPTKTGIYITNGKKRIIK